MKSTRRAFGAFLAMIMVALAAPSALAFEPGSNLVLLCIEDGTNDPNSSSEDANPGPFQGSLSHSFAEVTYGPKKGDFATSFYMSCNGGFADFDEILGVSLPLWDSPDLWTYVNIDETGEEAKIAYSNSEDAATILDPQNPGVVVGWLRAKWIDGTFHVNRTSNSGFISHAKRHWEFVLVTEAEAQAYQNALYNAPQVEAE